MVQTPTKPESIPDTPAIPAHEAGQPPASWWMRAGRGAWGRSGVDSVLVTLATLAAIVVLPHLVIGVPNPSPIYLVAVIYTTFRGGVRAGLLSALLTLLFTLSLDFLPGHPLHDTNTNAGRMAILAVVTPAIVLLIGALRTRSERETLRAVRTALLEGQLMEGQQARAELSRLHDDLERRARDSEQERRDLLDLLPDGVLVHTAGTIHYANPASARLTGVADCAAMVGESVFTFVHPDDHRELRARLAARSDAGDVNPRWQCRVLQPDGAVRLIETVSVRHTHEGQRAVLVVIRDVTDQRQTEAALREQATLLDLSLNAVIVLNMDERITYWNRGAAELYGWSRADALGAHPAALLHTRWSSSHEEQQAALYATGRWEGELVHTRQNGLPVVVASRQVLVRDATDAPTAIFVVNTDISQCKRIEEELTESEARYRELVERSPQTVLVECEGKIAYINDAGAQLFGAREPEELIGLPLLRFAHPDDRKTVAERLRRGAAEPDGALLDFTRFCRLDGAVRAVASTSIPCMYRDKPALQVVLLDVTEQRRSEEALRESEERYRTTLEALTEGVQMKDARGKILTSNSAAARILGWDAAQIVGHMTDDPAWRIVGEDGQPFPYDRFPSAVTMQTGQPERDVVMGTYRPDARLSGSRFRRNRSFALEKRHRTPLSPPLRTLPTANGLTMPCAPLPPNWRAVTAS